MMLSELLSFTILNVSAVLYDSGTCFPPTNLGVLAQALKLLEVLAKISAGLRTILNEMFLISFSLFRHIPR
jgi:hypothetical protein